MKALVISTTNLRRFLRDRSNLFFAFVFPIALILIIGLQFGGSSRPELGIVPARGAIAEAIRAELEANEGLDLVVVPSRDRLLERVDEGSLDAGVVIPDDLDAAFARGDTRDVEFVADVGLGPQLRPIVLDAVDRAIAVPTAVAAVVDAGADRAAAERAAGASSSVLDTVVVESVTTGDRLFPEGLGNYDIAAPSQLVLFVFVIGLSGSYAVILTRKLGVASRMRSTPTSMRSIVLGEAGGRFVIAALEGVYILVATRILFGVDWGDLVGALATLLAFAAVTAGAALLFGTWFSSEEAASGVGVVAGLCLAALGGAMLPIELFGSTLASVARITPHYWALDAYAELIRHDGSIVDIVPQLAVLAAYAGVLFLVAAWSMRRVLTSAR